jgi:GNAT superfamily N-acetyltransferase
MSFLIRHGDEKDIAGIFRLVKELAEFERAPEAVVNTEKMLLEDGFGKNAIYKVFIAEEVATGDVIGMALYYTAYSTWKGRIFYLDDLIVTQRFRKFGIGQQLLDEVLKAAEDAGVNQIRWQVLDWNEPAINFYKKMGAVLDATWIDCKMSREDIVSYVAAI